MITEIDVKETLRKKLGIDFRKYKILGACTTLAHEAIKIEDKVGTMLRCNVDGAGDGTWQGRGRGDRSCGVDGGD